MDQQDDSSLRVKTNPIGTFSRPEFGKTRHGRVSRDALKQVHTSAIPGHEKIMEDQWPPKSPHHALISSPGGRRKYREIQESRLRTSQSPAKKSATISGLRRAGHTSDDDDANEDDDEETLQLRLQAIEAKLKLKKLQNKKAKILHGPDADNESEGSSCSGARPYSALSTRAERENGKQLLRSRSIPDIQIPLSPVKRPTIQPPEQKSPSRVLLGIDKGRSGKDVSLRRAPEAAKPHSDSLRQSSSRAPNSSDLLGPGRSTGTSFNERMATRRQQERQNLERKARSEALRQQRSTGFSVKSAEVESFKIASEQLPLPADTAIHTSTEFSRDEIVAIAENPRRAASRFNDRSLKAEGGDSMTSGYLASRTLRQKQRTPNGSQEERDQTGGDETNLQESISGTKLSRRILPHSFLARTLEGKTVVPLTTMLKTIQKPDWELPESVVAEDTDFVTFAIIGSKSRPLDHKAPHRVHDDDTKSTKTSLEEADELAQNEQRKFMVLTLVSPCLKWSVDLFLFSTGFTRWRMLTPGTLIAILNPGIMPPPPNKTDTNRWSLRLSSSDDTILEVGTSRDLGWCQAVKRGGEPCGAWVDRTKFSYCEWHVQQGVERAKSSRMETQSSGFGGRRDEKGGRSTSGSHRPQKADRESDSRRYDWSAHSAYYISSSGLGGRGTTSLLDADEGGIADRGAKGPERMRKLLAEREKEKRMAQQLATIGSGAGAEYMRQRHSKPSPDHSLPNRSDDKDEDSLRDKISAKDLGLHGGTAATVQLSPLKRKKSTREPSARKKTRFVTEKGIREAGRESLPMSLHENDDSDDLEII